MKIVHIIKLHFAICITIVFILQVNGTLLSRFKNRYEYLPLSTKDFTVKDITTVELAPASKSSSKVSRNVMVLDEINPKFIQLYEPSSLSTGASNTTRNYSKSTTAINGYNFLKRTIYSENDFNYDELEKWPNIKLFAASTTTTNPLKYKRKTWPSYFPPKFISKLQAELDSALAPWKPTSPIPTSISNNVSGIEKVTTEDTWSRANRINASCYMCGLDQEEIPRMPSCYHYFESDDHRVRKLRRRFKVKCIKSSVEQQIKKEYYGPNYTGGCFKRFLDVGYVYNERGCRTTEPTRGKSFASKRLAYLEKMLVDTDNGCVFSPYASLTPFSRAISLYARYHVCVCDTRYCNYATRNLPLNIYKYFMLILYFSKKA